MWHDWWMAHRLEVYATLALIPLAGVWFWWQLRPQLERKPLDWSKLVPKGGGGTAVVPPPEKQVYVRVQMILHCADCNEEMVPGPWLICNVCQKKRDS